MTTTVAESSGRNQTEVRIEEYLADRLGEDSRMYLKSKEIADDLGISTKEVAAHLLKLEESAGVVDIEAWATTRATTWQITQP